MGKQAGIGFYGQVAALLLSTSTFAYANPVDGVVSAGSASIAGNGNTLTVTQTSSKAVIDWRGFDIAPHETTEFVQPGSHAIALNRVHSSQASHIQGNLKANGNIMIVNQNGVIFGAGSKVDVNGLVASSADISNADFMAGNFRFHQPGNPNASVENHGTITAREAGLVGLVAPNVLNSGVITARLGRVQLASGDTFTVDLYGDGLMEVKASDALQSQLVQNSGTINAEGGIIALTAAAGAAQVNSLIDVGGTLNARGIAEHGGKIYIFAEGANNVPGRTGQSTVRVHGKLDVSNPTGKGGRIDVLADRVEVASTAILNTDGATGGGEIHVGGDFHGAATLPTAQFVSIENGALFSASATAAGNGGQVSVWADDKTEFNGRIEANGAGDHGDGGNVETSGRVALLINEGRVLASGRRRNGQWLLDPTDVNIDSTYAATIKSSLDGGTNVTVATAVGAGNGDITVSSAISTTGSGNLTLSAYRNITVNAGITLQGGSLTLAADNTGTGTGAITITAAISKGTGAVNFTANNLIVSGAGSLINTGVLTIANAASGGTIGIGTGAGTLSIDTTELGVLGAGSYVFGSTTSGDVTINTTQDFGAKNVTLISGNDINLAGTLTKATGGAATYLFQANRDIYNSNGAGITLSGSSNLILDADYDQAGNAGGRIALTDATISVSSIVLGGGADPLTGYAQGRAGAQEGIRLENVVMVLSTNVTMRGRGYGVGSNNYGVYILGSTSDISGLYVGGIGGGDGAGTNNHGVYIAAGRLSGGSLVVEGQGGNLSGTGGANHGIYNQSGASFRPRQIIGTKGGQSDSYGVYNTGSIYGGGNMLISTDTIYSTGQLRANNILAIAPKTNIGVSIGANVAGTLNISETVLGALVSNDIVLGSTTLADGITANTGDVTINTTRDFADRNITFVSGNDIILAGSLTRVTGNAAITYKFQANRDIYNTNSAGVDGRTSTLIFNADYDQATTPGGRIALTGATLATINLIMGGGANPLTGYAQGRAGAVEGIRLEDVTCVGTLSSLSIRGRGYGIGSNNYGVYLQGSNTSNTAAGAGLIVGIGGGNGAGTNNYGVYAATGTATAAGITVEGYGGNLSGTGGANHGVYVTGTLRPNVVKAVQGGQASSYGIYSTGSIYGGNMTLYTDTLYSTGILRSSGNPITVASYSNIGISIGTSVAGTLNINTAALTSMGPNSNIIFGSTVTADGVTVNTGDITINTTYDFNDRNLTFISGRDIFLNGKLARAVGTAAVNYNFYANRDIYNSNSGSVQATTGQVNMLFNADRDGNNEGSINFNSTSDFISNGGNIILGGGSGTITGVVFNADGTIATAATGYAVGDAQSQYGVRLNTILDAGGGNIIINGLGYAGTGDQNLGIIQNGAIKTSGTGTIALSGIGGGSGSSGSNHGVQTTGDIMTTGTGRIGIAGRGGSGGTGTNQVGVYLNLGTISAAGGDILVNGAGSGTTAGGNRGVLIRNTVRNTGNGNITIVGTGGSAVGSTNNDGVNIYGASAVATAAGTLSISGTGGTNSYGVYLNAADAAGTTGGNLILKGIGAGTAQGIYAGVANAVTTTGGGNITLYADSLLLNAANNINASGVLTLAPYTNIGMSVGTNVAGTLNLDTASHLAYLNAGSYVFGSVTNGDGTANTHDVTINTTKDFGDKNVTFVSGNDLILGGTLTKGSGTGTATYTFNANHDIYNTNSASITATSGAANLIFNADRDQLTTPGGAIEFTNGTLTTNGGYVVMGGGLDPLTGYALGNGGRTSGIHINSTPITTNGGAITLHGKGPGNGIQFTSTSLTSANGAMLMDGVSTSSGYGIRGSSGSLNAGNGSVTMTGVGAGSFPALQLFGNIIGNGITLNGNIVLSANITLTGGAGDITLNGTVNSVSSLVARDLTLDTSGKVITNGIIGGQYILNNLSITADDVELGGNLYGSGTLTIQPKTTTQHMRLGGAYTGSTAGYLTLSTTELGYLADGWSGINLGRTNGTGDINIGASSWADPVNFYNQHKTVQGTLTGTGNASFTFLNNSYTHVDADITTAGGAIDFSAPTYTSLTGGLRTLTSNGGNVTFRRILMRTSTSSGTINTGGGNISITDTIYTNADAAGQTLAFNAGTGNVNFGNTVDTAGNITASGSTVTFGGDWGGTTPLGAVSLTSTNGITLPSITASSILARTTGATSDMAIASGKTLTATGTGNALTLAAGRNFINSSGSTALSAANGRWLVYSASMANNTRGGLMPDASEFNKTYTGNAPATIASGNRFIYSSATAPTIVLTADHDSVTYGDAYTAADLNYSYTSGLVGGDSWGSIGLTGSAGLSTSYVQGTTGYSPTAYTGMINGTTGTLASKLGYQFSFTAGNLTVNKRVITAVLANATKTYDGTNRASLGSGNFTYSNIYGSDAVSVAGVSGTYANENAGSGKNVSVTGLTLTGAKAVNYQLASTSASANVGTINQRALTVTTNPASKYESDPDPAFNGYNNLLAGDAAQITWGYAPIGYSGTTGHYTIGATATDPNGRLANYIRSNNYGTFTVHANGYVPPPPPPTPPVVPSSVEVKSQVPVTSDQQPPQVRTGFTPVLIQVGDSDSPSSQTDPDGLDPQDGFEYSQQEGVVRIRISRPLAEILQISPLPGVQI